MVICVIHQFQFTFISVRIIQFQFTWVNDLSFLAYQEQNNFGLPVSNYEKTFGIPMELF